MFEGNKECNFGHSFSSALIIPNWLVWMRRMDMFSLIVVSPGNFHVFTILSKESVNFHRKVRWRIISRLWIDIYPDRCWLSDRIIFDVRSEDDLRGEGWIRILQTQEHLPKTFYYYNSLLKHIDRPLSSGKSAVSRETW